MGYGVRRPRVCGIICRPRPSQCPAVLTLLRLQPEAERYIEGESPEDGTYSMKARDLCCTLETVAAEPAGPFLTAALLSSSTGRQGGQVQTHKACHKGGSPPTRMDSRCCINDERQYVSQGRFASFVKGYMHRLKPQNPSKPVKAQTRR